MIINTAILAGEKLELIEEAHLVIEEGVIRGLYEGYTTGGIDLKDYVTAPGPINAHTHVGDSFAKEAALGLSIKEAVGRDGIKWRLYKETERNTRVKAMRESMKFMLSSGTTCFADFREFGWEGVEELEEALDSVPLKAVILGRNIDINDVDGLGLNLYEIDQIPEDRGNKLIALHAGELEGEVGEALKHNPDIIVHCTHASEAELEEIAEKKISVVVCPRSNSALKVGVPPIQEMLDLGINVALGTDNVMINSPNMWREMEYVSKSCSIQPIDVFRMASVNAAKALRLDSGVIERGKKADLVVIEKDALNLRYNVNILSTLVNRCETENVLKVMVNGKIVFSRR